MRQRALNMGYTFNEHGTYNLDEKKKGKLVDHVFTDEKSIFDFLNMQYKTPEERVDGRAVQTKTIPEGESANKKLEGEEIAEIPVISTKTTKPTKISKTNKTNKTIQKNAILEEAKINVVNELENDKQIEENIEAFKKLGISLLEQLSEQDLAHIIQYANKKYYNQTPLLSDNEYDIIKEYMEKKFPKNAILLEVGAPITSNRNKVQLPYEMPSMDKIKPDTGALDEWKAKYKGPYVLSCKLDGVSALYTTEGPEAKLYTRGNGKIGQDISHLIPYLRLPLTKDITIRGELLITKADFDSFLKNKFANPRNLVSGLVNQKQIDDNVSYLHFVAYEVIKPELKPSDQMSLLRTLDVDVVLYRITNNINNEKLSEMLMKWRKEYIYEIDGIIVTDDKIYPRKSGNPEHAFAFKMVLSDQIAEAKVVDVIWNASKDGYLKPRVRIEPIQLGGVTIEYATGFNGAFIEQNKIGIGALVEIIRSGDVIPHIRGVTVPAEEAKMPSVPYKWNETHVDVLLEDLESDPLVKEKNIAGFFKGIKVDGLSSGNVHRIMEAGFDSVSKIIKMSESDFLKVEGFKKTLAHKIHSGIQEKVKDASLVVLMSTSNIFGRGISEKKIELIMGDLPNILTSGESREKKIEMVSNVKGMAKKTAENFVEKIEPFLHFLEETGLQDKLTSDNSNLITSINIDVNHPLYKKNIVFTGVRDKELMDKIKSVGGNLAASVSKNTFAVIVKTKEEDTGKAEEARKLNIPVFTVEEFTKMYF
jgi:NAD-dependent DNA ligase